MENYIVSFGCFNILVMLFPLLKAHYPSLVPWICSMTKVVERGDIALFQKKRKIRKKNVFTNSIFYPKFTLV